jgi:hypothetical protein
MTTLTTNTNSGSYTTYNSGSYTTYVNYPTSKEDYIWDNGNWRTGNWTVPLDPLPLPLIDNDKVKKLEKELEDSKERIKQLEKKLNDFIDNPERVKNIRKIDPFDEENWDE